MSDLEYLCTEVRRIARAAGVFLKKERETFDRNKVKEKSGVTSFDNAFIVLGFPYNSDAYHNTACHLAKNLRVSRRPYSRACRRTMPESLLSPA